MPEPLLVSEENPVNLDGSIDGSNNLQIKHGSDSLADYGQTLHAEHDELNTPGKTIRIKLFDFSHGGYTWAMNASHDDGGTVNWTRGSDHAYYNFGAMTSELQVDTSATSNAQPPVTKTRTILIKTMPSDGDR
jgi:hypothetical protein